MTFPKLTENTEKVLKERYLRKNEEGEVIETSDELFRRVAKALAAVERKFEGCNEVFVEAVEANFYKVLRSLDFLPNSPTLANAGANNLCRSACIVLPVGDDMADIFNAVRDAALCHQAGAGTGFSFSRLRPRNDRVGSTKGVSSGPVSFMQVFNAATEAIKQGGMRRGANMGILRVDHPDILEFIRSKDDLSKMTNFNISVAVTNAFMQAVADDSHYNLVNPRTGFIVDSLHARTVFAEVIQRAWGTGEPGLVFIDRMNVDCPVPWLGEYEATNPCGEQPLIPNESCNLGSINLENFVFVGGIDWKRLRQVVHTAVRMLDNVIEENTYPTEEITRVTHLTRKIGLGVMGFARMLFKLDIRYGSRDSVRIAEMVMSFIDYESKSESVRLAEQRGAFPARDGNEDVSNAFYENLFDKRNAFAPIAAHYGSSLKALLRKHGIRNSTTTTVAPTGTLSIVADTSGGCEPVFALAFKRRQAGLEMVDVDKLFLEYAQHHGFYSEELMAAIVANHGSLQGLDANTYKIPQEAFQIFVTAHDIPPMEHVDVQAAFQKYNDSATSKTINFPESATIDDVRAAYEHAWATGCKGITIYRNNSRSFQPLSVSEAKKPVEGGLLFDNEAPVGSFAEDMRTMLEAEFDKGWNAGEAHANREMLFDERSKRSRPDRLPGFTDKVETADGVVFLTFNYDAMGLREVFANVGRSGGVLHSCSEAIGRLLSLGLAYHVPVEQLAATLMGIRSNASHGFGENKVFSIPDAIGKALHRAPQQLRNEFAVEEDDLAQRVAFGPGERRKPHPVHHYGESPECPECGGEVVHAEGCVRCLSCSFNKCG